MSTSTENLSQKLATLNDKRASVMSDLQKISDENGLSLNLSIQIPEITRSPIEVDSRVLASYELLNSALPKTDPILVPKGHFKSITALLDELITHYNFIAESLTNIQNNGGPGILNTETLNLSSKNGAFTLQLGQVFQQIWNTTDNLLSAVYPFLNAIGNPSQGDFSALLSQFNQVMHQINTQQQKLSDLTRDAQLDQKKISASLAKILSSETETERLRSEAEKDRKTLLEYATEGTQSIATIKASTEQATALQTTVDSYKATFDNFQIQLKEREETLKKGDERQKVLFEQLETMKKDINNLNVQAESMLSGATVAGLAGSFAKLRDDLSRELGWARASFYCAVVLLFVSVIPLALYLFPGIINLQSSSHASSLPTAIVSEESPLEMMGHIFARMILLLPAAWFARFAARRHANLFKLKQHYAYKYSVASSVDGFKKQAEPFKDAIAAATFFELTFNPADRMDSQTQDDRHPNPAMEWVMKKLGATHDGKSS